MRPDKETIIRAMNELEAWLSVMYYDCTEEAHEEHLFIINELSIYLGFDGRFNKLNIKW